MKKYKKWTDDELRILREMWPTHFASDISDLVGHSTDVVRNKAYALGLTKAASFDETANYGKYTNKGKFKK